MILAQYATGVDIWAVLILLTLSTACFFGRYGPFWTLPTELLPTSVAGAGIGLINGAGNIGGVFGPLMFGYVRGLTGSFSIALIVAGVSLVLSGVVALPIRSRPPNEPKNAFLAVEAK